MTKQFYSYLWLREDGSPYYAGKGHGRRAFQSDGHGVHRPKDRARIMVFPMLNEQEAIDSEIAMIWLFGRKDNGTGCLRNLTDGGDGISGFKHSEEFCIRQSKQRTGKKHAAETKQKIRESNTGKHHSDESKQKISIAKTGKPNFKLRGVPRSAEVRRKISIAKTGKPGHLAWNKGVPVAQEVKDKISAKLTGRKASEETKKKIGDKRRGHTHTEDTKQQIREKLLGNIPWNKGKAMVADQKKKISATKTGKPWSAARRKAHEDRKNAKF